MNLIIVAVAGVEPTWRAIGDTPVANHSITRQTSRIIYRAPAERYPKTLGQVVVAAKPLELYLMPAVPFIIIIWLALAGGLSYSLKAICEAPFLSIRSRHTTNCLTLTWLCCCLQFCVWLFNRVVTASSWWCRPLHQVNQLLRFWITSQTVQAFLYGYCLHLLRLQPFKERYCQGQALRMTSMIRLGLSVLVL